MPTLYEKRGRRYQFWGSAEQWNSCDMLKAGDFRLEYHAGNGERQYSYITDPALAQVEGGSDGGPLALSRPSTLAQSQRLA